MLYVAINSVSNYWKRGLLCVSLTVNDNASGVEYRKTSFLSTSKGTHDNTEKQSAVIV